MNTETTLQQLGQLKLEGMAKSYQAILNLPVHSQPDAHTLIAQLMNQNKMLMAAKERQDLEITSQGETLEVKYFE